MLKFFADWFRDLKTAANAKLTVQITNPLNDPDFIAEPPTCTVIVTAKYTDGRTDEGFKKEFDMTPTTPLEKRTVVVPAQDVAGTIARLAGEKTTLRQIKIEVKPRGSWSDRYENTEVTLTLSPKEERNEVIELTRKPTFYGKKLAPPR